MSTAQVRFIGATDEQAHWGRGVDPRQLLTVGAVYELLRVEKHDWHTLYHLVGIADNGRGFNSICFELLATTPPFCDVPATYVGGWD